MIFQNLSTDSEVWQWINNYFKSRYPHKYFSKNVQIDFKSALSAKLGNYKSAILERGFQVFYRGTAQRAKILNPSNSLSLKKVCLQFQLNAIKPQVSSLLIYRVSHKDPVILYQSSDSHDKNPSNFKTVFIYLLIGSFWGT